MVFLNFRAIPSNGVKIVRLYLQQAGDINYLEHAQVSFNPTLGIFEGGNVKCTECLDMDFEMIVEKYSTF